jgi:hypothetical protein
LSAQFLADMILPRCLDGASYKSGELSYL